MKLGISLPITLVPELNRGLFLDWARQADRAGFHALATIDQPGYDSWDPLASLAAAAAVTERTRLATTILQLPNRNEVLVAKQAAVIDRLSGGRMDLGVAVGMREADYKAFGARFAGRGKKIERQIRKIRRTWRAAKKATPQQGTIGPAPMQKPLPPIWIGGKVDAAIARATTLGDGFVFGTAGAARMAELTPKIRAMAQEAGKKTFPVAGLAYVAIGDTTGSALEEAAQTLTRYYMEDGLPRPADDMVHNGPVDVIAEAVKEYEAAGLDLLYLVPLVASVKQVDRIAEDILPAYRVPGH